jgi:hypothetical protein
MATYILCIEHRDTPHLRQTPGPPVLQANTICKEPFEPGLALKNPPKKTHPKKPKKNHLKKPTKNVFFWVFLVFLNF